jgi:hypothetical protein
MEPLSEDDISAIRLMLNRFEGTHFEGCHRSHPRCAVARLLAERDRLETELDLACECRDSGRRCVYHEAIELSRDALIHERERLLRVVEAARYLHNGLLANHSEYLHAHDSEAIAAMKDLRDALAALDAENR